MATNVFNTGLAFGGFEVGQMVHILSKEELISLYGPPNPLSKIIVTIGTSNFETPLNDEIFFGADGEIVEVCESVRVNHPGFYTVEVSVPGRGKKKIVYYGHELAEITPAAFDSSEFVRLMGC